MPLRSKHLDDFEFQHPGFSTFSGKPDPGVAHRHDDLELAINEHAGGTSLFGGRQFVFPSERLVVTWGAMPHKPLEIDPATISHGIRVPMHWVLQWKLPDALIRPLLNFEVIVDCKRDSPCSDLALLKHWVRLMRSGRPEDREIVLLEVHARLLRLAGTLAAKGAKGRRVANEPESQPPSELGLVERILKIVSDRYHQPLNIQHIARELRVSRTHVMRQFRKVAGITLLDYLTQHRVSCAQRLMMTTDTKIVDVAHQAGFGSQGQFYTCFKRVTGQSPARYRRSLRR